MLVGDLLNYTLRLSGILGVGQSPLQQDEDDALVALEKMALIFQRRRWLVFRLDSTSHPMEVRKAIYTVGPGGDFDTGTASHRPGSVESAFLRQLTGWGAGGLNATFPVDYPLVKMYAREEWNAIPLKNLGSWPARFFYDPTLPLGTLYIWPVPIQTFFEVHISYSQDIATIFNLAADTAAFLPGEAEEALIYNLACRLRVNYRLPPDQAMVALAQSALNTLRTNNFSVRPLRMPASLQSPSRFKNPMGGFFPETIAGIPFPVLS